VWKFGDIKHTDGTVILPAPTDRDTVLRRLRQEIKNSIELLKWLCLDTHNFYISTNSYKRLRILSTDVGIDWLSA
jgi:hypothetical protein